VCTTVERIVNLLDCLIRERGPIRLTTIADRVVLPRSTVHRLLSALVRLGVVRRTGHEYVICDLRDRWCAGTRADRQQLRRVSMPHLAELFLSQQLITSLAVLDDDMSSVDYLITLYTRKHASLVAPVAERAPAASTAAGKVLLAFAPPGAAAPIAPAQLLAIRRAGIALSCQEDGPGAAAMAVPILDRNRVPLAAISVGGPDDSFSPSAVEGALRRTARTVADALRTFRV
jgi:DNA-binding IclR family transcriptional regulator